MTWPVTVSGFANTGAAEVMMISPAIAARRFLRINHTPCYEMIDSCRRQRLGVAELRHDFDRVPDILDRRDVAPDRASLVALRLVDLFEIARAVELRHDLVHRQAVIRRGLREQLTLRRPAPAALRQEFLLLAVLLGDHRQRRTVPGEADALRHRDLLHELQRLRIAELRFGERIEVDL